MALQAAKAKRTAAAAPASGRRPGTDPATVARVAYELFLARGGAHGHDLEDWLRAEQLVRRQQGGNRR